MQRLLGVECGSGQKVVYVGGGGQITKWKRRWLHRPINFSEIFLIRLQRMIHQQDMSTPGSTEILMKEKYYFFLTQNLIVLIWNKLWSMVCRILWWPPRVPPTGIRSSCNPLLLSVIRTWGHDGAVILLVRFCDAQVLTLRNWGARFWQLS